MRGKGQHILRTGDGWAVRRSGAARASKIFDTQEEAVKRGKELAKDQGTQLYVYGKDGRVRQRINYQDK